MADIEWCRKKGLKLIEPNSNLAEEYYRNAEETLKVTNLIKDSGSNMWLATQKYYTEYLAAYALLMRIGIKTEIHSCTIKIIELLQEKDIIDFNYADMLKDDKELRIDNQYYLKNRPVDLDSNKLAQLLLKIRHILDTIAEKKIDEIRNLI